MIKDLILLLAPIIFFLSTLFFLGVKLFRVVDLPLDADRVSVFFRSLLNYDRTEIRNTFQEGLKRYYQDSNRFNKIYYAAGMSILGVYLLVHFL